MDMLARRSIRSFIRAMFLIGLGSQVYLWQGDAHRIAWFYLKSQFDELSSVELGEWARVCLARGHDSCAESHLRELVNREVRSRWVYQELAQTLARQGRHKEALPFFRQAMEGVGVKPYEALAYARTLIASGDLEAGLVWYYQNIFESYSSEIVLELSEILAEQGRFEESLSLLYSARELDHNLVWSDQIQVISERWLKEEGQEPSRVRMISLDGRIFRLPIRHQETGGIIAYGYDSETGDWFRLTERSIASEPHLIEDHPQSKELAPKELFELERLGEGGHFILANRRRISSKTF